MTEYYTGIGSRATPVPYLIIMKLLASKLEKSGVILRSGGAAGADSAFESGVTSEDNMEIYVPLNSGKKASHHINKYSSEIWKKSESVVSEIHPAWSYLPPYSRALHTRNCFQILGKNLDTPSRFVLCWTSDGAERYDQCSKETGGTGTAIKIACLNRIPVYNLSNSNTLEKILKSFIS